MQAEVERMFLQPFFDWKAEAIIRMAVTRTVTLRIMLLYVCFLVGISPLYSFSFAPHSLQYLAQGGSILVPQKG